MCHCFVSLIQASANLVIQVLLFGCLVDQKITPVNSENSPINLSGLTICRLGVSKTYIRFGAIPI